MDKQGTFDLIGDIHGQAEKLEQLLAVLGYDKVQGVYRHPTNQAVFVGDFIDRGPNNCRVIEIVRAMVEQGHALAVMGNHEFNAICYHTPHPTKPGEWLRPHKDENNKQHQAVLDEYKEKKEELAEAIAWFKTLPLFLELDGLRVIHACWNQPAIDRLRPRLGPGDTLTEDLFVDASEKGSAAHNDIELLLKGPEFPLPEGHSFKDKDGHVRHAIRIAWWGGQPANWGAMALHAEHVPSELREKPIPAAAFDFYPSEAPPVFIGHYWLHGSPHPQRQRRLSRLLRRHPWAVDGLPLARAGVVRRKLHLRRAWTLQSPLSGCGAQALLQRAGTPRGQNRGLFPLPVGHARGRTDQSEWSRVVPALLHGLAHWR